MTGDDSRWGLGQLGRRLLAAFLLVALSSVVVLTAGALFGTARGISAGADQSREATAQTAATAAAVAYKDAGGWEGANLEQAQAIAATAGLQLVVQRASGARKGDPGQGDQGAGDQRSPGLVGEVGQGDEPAGGQEGAGAIAQAPRESGTPSGGRATHSESLGDANSDGDGPHTATAPVVVDGTTVGLVRLVGAGSTVAGTAQRVAWTWILTAAGVAVIASVATAWFVSRRLSAPLTDLTKTTRAFAAGNRAARPSPSSLNAPGELGELARSFDSTADTVTKYEQSRRRMTADIAHEIRTPLAALQAGLEEVRDELVPADADVIAGLHAQSLRLGRIISDLSQLSEAESADLSLHRERVNLSTLVEHAVVAATPAIVHAGMKVAVESTELLIVDADPDRIHQALSNVLMNTVRHCRAGDTVDVRTAVSGDGAVVTVSDTGPGIPQADLPHVFDRLWRGTSDSDTGGLGIGLAIVRAVTLAHGGSVDVASGNEGTTFTLRFPLAGD